MRPNKNMRLSGILTRLIDKQSKHNSMLLLAFISPLRAVFTYKL
jgi:hypothetical protein